jgi:hypothetical protein
MAYDSALATKLAKKVRRDLARMCRENVSWCGMTKWFLWAAAARHGIVEIVDVEKAQWGDRRGVKVKPGCRRTLDVAWRRVFAD